MKLKDAGVKIEVDVEKIKMHIGMEYCCNVCEEHIGEREEACAEYCPLVNTIAQAIADNLKDIIEVVEK